MNRLSPDMHTLSACRAAIVAAHLADETAVVEALLSHIPLSAKQRTEVVEQTSTMVEAIRQHPEQNSLIENFLAEYGLSSEEGSALMCLAEALLRTPDADTMDRLLQDKLSQGDWQQHLGHSQSAFVNASTWAFVLGGKVVNGKRDDVSLLQGLVQRSGEALVRHAALSAMRLLGHQFVLGENLHEAVTMDRDVTEYSYDMLGEAAMTDEDAERYFRDYQKTIVELGLCQQIQGHTEGAEVSVKLSALCSRYEYRQRGLVMRQAYPRLRTLCLTAQAQGVCLTLDAEESERLELSLDLVEKLSAEQGLKHWPGLGLAVQAYQKRALPLLQWLQQMAQSYGRRYRLRLVKGAYWDREIKSAQQQGLSDYPVFSQKANTDLSYLACAAFLCQHPHAFYPQFASHNALSLNTVMHFYRGQEPLEIQRLYGMGESVHQQLCAQHACRSRVYAPVGAYRELLPYLVRRLLENGANTAFVHQLSDPAVALTELVTDPLSLIKHRPSHRHPQIPLPSELYPDRRNAQGYDLTSPAVIDALKQQVQNAIKGQWLSYPGATPPTTRAAQDCYAPANGTTLLGRVYHSTHSDVESAYLVAHGAYPAWCAETVETRALLLEKAADLIESEAMTLYPYLIFEAGKTWDDAVAEVREAVDFCRYYAQQARVMMAHAQILHGPTGEQNRLSLRGRGVFVCISPWNFPLAILVGQISAALVSGNAVLAKPSSQTALIAQYLVALFYRAGIPNSVLHLLPGSGSDVGKALIQQPHIAGVAFTGSLATAKHIQQSLSEHHRQILPLIAETGGQNAMIVDATALPEQVVKDVIDSAFRSAGQRCSALRVLFLQREIAAPLITLLTGAMDTLVVGDPQHQHTDIGPVIDQAALDRLHQHRHRMESEAELIFRCPLPDQHLQGTFYPPECYRLQNLQQLGEEVFGPILHVIEYEAKTLPDIINDINLSAYGLTLGLHSRINETINLVSQKARVGNIYINRNMVGAVVGVQPFGGEGLSGTGPKAGGPNYLSRFVSEQTVTENTSALGGNARLLMLDTGQ